MKKTKLILFLLTSYIFTSCVSRKDIVYFQNDKIDQTKVYNSYKTVFKADDLLQINISAADLDAVKPFNLSAVTYATSTNRAIGTPQQQAYLIDNKGYINFPVLGKLKLAGLTRVEVIDLLKNKLDPDYIRNPSINITISNFSITVLGAVARPGRFTIPNERITVLEALGLAGDLDIGAVRNNVKVHREENGTKKTYELDLRSNSIFTSPAYYLQQNDVVYAEPNKPSSQDAAYNRNSGLFISIASLLITVVTLLIR